ncbi:heterokaryon incompatibility protein-domain-containing protein [Xylaria palmicola]|nr:heterokaryon incompatibility protein-domain-containing protein [Xylaria palmicola]
MPTTQNNMASSMVLRRDSACSQEKADSQLCWSCRKCLLEYEASLGRQVFDLFRWAFFSNGRSIRVLVKNAKKGCVACNLFLQSLSEQDRLLLTRSRHAWYPSSNIVEYERESVTDIIISYPLCKEDLQNTVVKQISLGLTVYQNIRQEIEDTSLISRQGDGNDIWSRAKQWLHECIEEDGHETCRVQITLPELPTRLIFVPKNSKNVRLCLTGKFKQKYRIKYLTLSHCWGKIPMPLVATRDNLESLLTNIPYDRLTKTFQDAITATQRLGFEYIWIDSLCILQGDEQDWLLEASRMADVYSGCTINLVAADGPDGSVGLFFERDAQTIRTDIYHDGQHIQCSPRLHTYLSRTATGSRGWCFQETLLSPRSLYFCKSQLFWECRASRAHESVPIARPWVLNHIPLRAWVVERGGHMSEEEIAAQWMRLVIPYSSTAVSFPKDKLFAFSGIARLFVREKGHQADDSASNASLPDFGYRYLAGMWRFGLEYQLLWHVSHGAKRPRKKSLLAPSWSWASVDGAMKSKLVKSFQVPGTREPWTIRDDFEIIDCTTNLTTSDIYGEVDGGALKVRCAPLERIRTFAGRKHLKSSNLKFSNLRYGDVYFDSSDSHSRNLRMVPVLFKNDKTWGLIVEGTKTKRIYRRVGVYRMKSWSGVEVNRMGSLSGARGEKQIMAERPSRIIITII